MLKKNDLVEITIDDLTVEGAGIGRHNGMAVFVPRALPGETVVAKIIKLTKSYAVGRLMNISRVSQDRVQPFCEVFNACGGCTLQHLSYAGQLRYKSRYVQQCMARIGGIEIEPPEIEPCENLRGYRNKASFPVTGEAGHARAGFFALRSHNLVECDCPIQQPAINEVKNAVIRWANKYRVPPYNETEHSGVLRHIVARQSSAGGVMAGVVVRDRIDDKTLVDTLKDVPCIESVVVNVNRKKGNVRLGDDTRVIYGRDHITEEYDGLKFRASLQSFLQVNHAQAEKLYRIAMDYADITPDDVVFDLFCGIGTMSLLAARYARKVLGIEYEPSAVRNAEENAQLNGIANAQFLAGDAGEMLKKGIDIAGAPDIVILDPPRKGCDAALIESIAAVSPKRVVYVSCNPATLARDTALFTKLGYKVERLRCVDMFPHTTHVECVTLMSRVEE
ncbi:MAG: 23S rRNA (uracil(1939)-C(5))-methyltransferase RlmD [Christensenellaceae bacterium]|nr:23S rRNA (uracil(1939)-C(5))-methyltransferase RlmD [Christensenellaceae bacterium]